MMEPHILGQQAYHDYLVQSSANLRQRSQSVVRETGLVHYELVPEIQIQ